MAVISPEVPRPDVLASAGTRLRVGMVAPPWFAVPPSGYGGIEAMVADLVDGLVERGHHVTLVAAGAPATSAQRFVATYAVPPSSRLGEAVPEVLHGAAAAAALEGEELDLVHDHSLVGALLAQGRRIPTVVTAHGPVAGELGDYLALAGEAVDVVAISRAQRQARADVHWAGTVHNAIDVGTYPFGAGSGGYVLFLGRFHPDKGAHLAIDAARSAGRRIVLAGKCNEPVEHAYFAEAVAPRLGAGVDYVGEAGASTKRELLAGAEALLFPVCWEEPFGLVMVEAMACGTPVVALRRGSVPEIVAHGRTGVVVDDPSLLPAAIAAASDLDRRACRAHAEQRFGVAAMVDGYEWLYRWVAARRASRELFSEVRPAATR